MREGLWCLALWGACAAAQAGPPVAVEVCYNYACAERAEVRLTAVDLDRVGALLADARDAPAEREAIATAVAALYRLAGEQTPIASDRAGNFLDAGVEGRMDCIDHATTTTQWLALMASRGWLRHHTVLEPSRRARLIFQHFAAVIEETDVRSPVGEEALRERGPEAIGNEAGSEIGIEVRDYLPVLLALCDCDDPPDDPSAPAVAPPDAVPAVPGARFAVDSWFVEHGEPAVILPLADWLNGEGPNVQ